MLLGKLRSSRVLSIASGCLFPRGTLLLSCVGVSRFCAMMIGVLLAPSKARSKIHRCTSTPWCMQVARNSKLSPYTQALFYPSLTRGVPRNSYICERACLTQIAETLAPYHNSPSLSPACALLFTAAVGKNLAPVWSVCAKSHRQMAVKMALAALKQARQSVDSGDLAPVRLTSHALARTVRANLRTVVRRTPLFH